MTGHSIIFNFSTYRNLIDYDQIFWSVKRNFGFHYSKKSFDQSKIILPYFFYPEFKYKIETLKKLFINSVIISVSRQCVMACSECKNV